MTAHAWVASFTAIEVNNYKWMSCELAENDIQQLSKILRDLKHGESLGSDSFPDQFWGTNKAKEFKRLPQIFKAAGYWVVSSKTAEIFRKFDLSGGGLYPVEILQKDRKTPVEGDYFCLCFGNKKSALVWDQSSSLTAVMPGNTDYWSLDAVPADDSVVLSSVALSGPDLWIDPALWGAFFVSDGLAQALKAAKVDGPFSFTRCMVV